jgi:small subunit ribosomal protein S16
MIKLRLKRFGKKRETSFRIVACNSTSRRDGRPLEELGFYNPRTNETRLDTDALRRRLDQGAQPSDTVRTLLENGGLITKTIRAAQVVGKAKQAAAREAEAKATAIAAAEAKAAEQAAAAAAEAAATEASAAAAAAETAAEDTAEAEVETPA